MGIGVRHGSEGFTGLEAALILVAFIVVAAVFSYVILGAGFFSVQKSQQVIYSAVEESSSPLILENPIYGLKNESSGKISSLVMTIGKKYGTGNPLDISKITVTWSDEDDVVTIPKSDPLYSDNPALGTWGVTDKQGDPEFPLYLESGEYATLAISLSPENEVSGKKSFSFELITTGNTLSFSSIVPQKIDTVTTLYQNG